MSRNAFPQLERDYAADLERADNARAEREALARSERHHAIEAEARDDSTRWFTLSNCTGSCLQGRSCNCVSDIDAEDETPARSAAVHVADIVIAAMLVGFAVAVVLGLVP